MIIKWQLQIRDGMTLIYLKTFETKKEAVYHYKTLYNKYPLEDYFVYYTPIECYPEGGNFHDEL